MDDCPVGDSWWNLCLAVEPFEGVFHQAEVDMIGEMLGCGVRSRVMRVAVCVVRLAKISLIKGMV